MITFLLYKHVKKREKDRRERNKNKPGLLFINIYTGENSLADYYSFFCTPNRLLPIPHTTLTTRTRIKEGKKARLQYPGHEKKNSYFLEKVIFKFIKHLVSIILLFT